jgi:membrane protein
MNARLKSLIHFLDDGIWRIREEEVSHLQWKVYTCLKIIYLSINQFINDRIVVRASALTYSTLLSIIPILALLFAIARGFGFDTLIESQSHTDENSALCMFQIGINPADNKFSLRTCYSAAEL